LENSLGTFNGWWLGERGIPVSGSATAAMTV
jgi:hypothetical protein